jgi:hypothetical protein
MFKTKKESWRSCYLTTGDIERCNELAGPIYPWPDRTHLAEKLDFLKRTKQNLFAE